MNKLAVAFIFFSILATMCMAIPNPLHASCKLDWNVGLDCTNAADKLIKQIDAWKGDDCGTSEKCLYTFESFDGKTLLAKHTTPKNHYVDDLKMVFTPSGNDCAIHGESTSELWYAVLDYGTNYCNLHNLITGSGLNKTKDFSEKTNDLKCTQYSSANCDKY
ncbi:hypothetical protein RRG08_026499 [Elysia crispata]|uniref:Uncharacterized protein n=1 Tax=Elysia crispata TaxID=231223 RepID=A0AAE0Y5C5_9GAST|nr:hypothetical protein RRG08_026499 [Elysia crispata]